MSFTPSFKLYASDGVTLIYTFSHVLNWDDGPFLDPFTYIEHVSLRGQGSIVTEGSQEAWDFILEFYLNASDYENLVSAMKTVSDTIVKNTKYILKIQLTSGGTTLDLKVKRLVPIRYPITTTRKVVKSQKGLITFRVNCWS